MLQALRGRMDEDEQGFTLIELLVVVIIIGILAAIAIPVFLNQRQRAWASAVQSDLRNGAIVMEEAFTDNPQDGYPDTTELLESDFVESPGVTVTVEQGAGTNGPFCLEGVHENLDDRTWSYWSAGGGVNEEPCGTTPDE